MQLYNIWWEMSGGLCPHRLTKPVENFQEAKHFVCSSLSYVFFGIFSRKDNFPLEMIESVANSRPTKLCSPFGVVEFSQMKLNKTIKS
jgi:hypothetical protein